MMKHDIKKLITDYLDGLVGKSIVIYKFEHAYGTSWFTTPSEGCDTQTTRKIVGSEFHFLGDYFGIKVFLDTEQEQPHDIVMFWGWDIPTFETID